MIGRFAHIALLALLAQPLPTRPTCSTRPTRPTCASAGSDLDQFMARVLARRDDNWRKLQQYVLGEREQAELLGPGHVRLYGLVRDTRGTSGTASSSAARSSSTG